MHVTRRKRVKRALQNYLTLSWRVIAIKTNTGHSAETFFLDFTIFLKFGFRFPGKYNQYYRDIYYNKYSSVVEDYYKHRNRY